MKETSLNTTSLEDPWESQSNIKTVTCELFSLERKVCHKLEEQASKLYIKALHDECLPIVCRCGGQETEDITERGFGVHRRGLERK